MTRLRCRYTLHLGDWRIPAGCGKVKRDDGEWLDWGLGSTTDQWVGGPCPSCAQLMLAAREDYRRAKADQVQWRAQSGGLKAELPEDPFQGMHEGDK